MSTTPASPYLASFPCPTNDTGRGLHFCLDTRQQFIDQYTPLMAAMKMSWTTVYGGDENTTTHAAKQLLDQAGIFSVLRVEARQERPLPTSFWAALVKKAISMGLPPYCQLYNEPEIEWGTAAKFAQAWNQRAQVIVDAGGYPGLQVMSQEFFDAAADGMSATVKQKFVYIVHNYGANHPLNYPYNIGKTPVEDDTCVLRFLAVADWAMNKLGFVMPIIGGEGGYQYQNADDKSLPPLTTQQWIDWNYGMLAWFRTGVIPAANAGAQPLPDYVFSLTPWLIYASNWYSDSWYYGLDFDQKKPLMDMLSQDTPYVRQFGGTTPPIVPPVIPPVVPPVVPPIVPPPTGIVDQRCPWVTFSDGTGYKVKSVLFRDSKPVDFPQSQLGVNIWIRVEDKSGYGLSNERVELHNGGVAMQWTIYGQTSYGQSGDSSFEPAKGQVGPYSIVVGDSTVSGMGLPLKQHVEYVLTIVKQ